jgi:predicted phosphodiesterase
MRCRTCRRSLNRSPANPIQPENPAAPSGVFSFSSLGDTMPARPLPDATIEKIRAEYTAGKTKSAIARQFGIDRQTVIDYTAGMKPNKAAAVTHSDANELPPSIDQAFTPHTIKRPGRWLILSDVHIPFHDSTVIKCAIERAREVGVVGVLLNGDILDSHELSDFDREPDAVRYVQEREYGLQFLGWLRGQLPSAALVYKEGNHEERLKRYIIKRAPALFGLEAVTLPALLDFKRFGVEWVDRKRIVQFGHLAVVHGHEFKSGISAPVNPARGFFLRAKECVLGGHHHQTSEHHEPSLSGRPLAAWSTGCCCGLNPQYMPVNKWNHGFAIVDLRKGGGFSVQNLRVMDGKII